MQMIPHLSVNEIYIRSLDKKQEWRSYLKRCAAKHKSADIGLTNKTA
jgi:hypothetical protein